jgi:hypothetical protein
MGRAADIEESVAVGPDGGRCLFRADDRYHGGPTGKALGPEADTADIQDFAEHVLRKESRLTSRFTSFTTEMKVARRFTSASDNRFIRKVELASLIDLESQGIIRMWDPDQVFEAMASGPRRLAKQAGDVRAAMSKNFELLIEGEIPPEVIRFVNE